MTGAIEVFVRELAEIELDCVFNPYSDCCSLHDRPDAASRRRANLALALDAAIDGRARVVWIARDLGYRGGRRTGLALTDEVHLESFGALHGGAAPRKATHGPAIAERTAAVVWRMLDRIGEPVFLWNVFPLHPHEPGHPMSNRPHTRGERRACERFMHWVLDLVRPELAIAIGGDAHMAAEGLGIESVRVRHPSYGGQKTFVEQVEAVYGLPPVTRSCLLARAG